MSSVDSKDSRKWINFFVVLIAVLTGYVTITFVEQLSEWFDLEAKLAHFQLLKQVFGVALGGLTFVFIKKNEKAVGHMNEVMAELKKVVWPEKNLVLRLTVGIIVAVSIVSSIFVASDYLFQQLLEMIY